MPTIAYDIYNSQCGLIKVVYRRKDMEFYLNRKNYFAIYQRSLTDGQITKIK